MRWGLSVGTIASVMIPVSVSVLLLTGDFVPGAEGATWGNVVGEPAPALAAAPTGTKSPPAQRPTEAATATSTTVPPASATATTAATATFTVTTVPSPSSTTPPSATPTTPAGPSVTPTVPSIGTATPTVTGSTTATSIATVTITPSSTDTTVTPTASTTTPTATLLPSSVPNDDFDNATLLTAFPFSTVQDTTKATVASDDPYMGAGAATNSNTVWFSFVAHTSGGLHAYTTGSSYDTVLAAFTGSRGNLTLVACNDDISAGVTRESDISFNLEAGRSYYLEVAQYGAPLGGQLKLTVEMGNPVTPTTQPTSPTGYWYPTYTPQHTSTLGPAPSNDDIGGAVLIGSFPFTDSRDTIWATFASDDPDMGSDTGANSNTVWYRLVAPEAGSVQGDTSGSDYDTVVAAFTGSRGNLTRVASNDDITTGIIQQSQIDFPVQAGQTYYLEVAQWGTSPGGGNLQLAVFFNRALGAIPTPWTTPGTTAGTVLGSTPPVIPSRGRAAGPVPRDARYFAETGYRVNLDPFWDFFQKRGGVRTFGYPISWEFPLLGFQVQFFQRGILQLMPDGSVATMNLLDEGLMPYNQINFSVFPKSDRELLEAAPTAGDPNYGEKVMAFLKANVPEEWEGMPVNFLQTYLSTVRYEDAFPQGQGEPSLVPLLNLELWGLPTSRPAYDPGNRDFVYQRFQRGILQWDASSGVTQGLLLADYLKGIITGKELPSDLDLQAKGSRYYHQLDSRMPGQLARPQELPGSNLEGAFDKETGR